MSQRIVLFPGLGANEKMYHAIRSYLPAIEVAPWLPIRNESLSSYAQRYVDLGIIRPSDVIGGCSFGGVLAQEIAQLVPVQKILLIGSCRHAEEIAPTLRRLAPLNRWFPITPQHARLAHWPIALKFGAFHLQHRRLLLDMISAADPRLVRWSIHAITSWSGCPQIAHKIAHIHGSRDYLMPVSRSDADTIIHGAGHFIAVTHASQVSEWIRKHISNPS